MESIPFPAIRDPGNNSLFSGVFLDRKLYECFPVCTHFVAIVFFIPLEGQKGKKSSSSSDSSSDSEDDEATAKQNIKTTVVQTPMVLKRKKESSTSSDSSDESSSGKIRIFISVHLIPSLTGRLIV